jgi:hypothetical protein
MIEADRGGAEIGANEANPRRGAYRPDFGDGHAWGDQDENDAGSEGLGSCESRATPSLSHDRPGERIMGLFDVSPAEAALTFGVRARSKTRYEITSS